MAVSEMKLSEAQREVLKRAIGTGWSNDKPSGRLMNYGLVSTTLNILLKLGLVCRDVNIRDENERKALRVTFQDCILAAQSALVQRGDWLIARRELNRAHDIQSALDQTAYWLTDAGMEMARSESAPRAERPRRTA